MSVDKSLVLLYIGTLYIGTIYQDQAKFYNPHMGGAWTFLNIVGKIALQYTNYKLLTQ